METVTLFSLLGLFKKWNVYIVLVTHLKLKRSHRSCYKILKSSSLLKNLDTLQNLRDSDVTRCGSGSDIGVEQGLDTGIGIH
jgi:hypothetical protein